MSVLFADQVGLFNQEGKAEFEVRRVGEKLLEGVRVMAVDVEDAKRVFLKQLAFVVEMDDLSPEEVADTEYVGQRIQTHLEEPEVRELLS